jgi:hypothetical protein
MKVLAAVIVLASVMRGGELDPGFGQGYIVQKGGLEHLYKLPVCTVKDSGYWEVFLNLEDKTSTLLLSKVNRDITQSFCRVDPDDQVRPLRHQKNEGLG